MRNQSARSIFGKWLETANNGSIYVKMDEIRSQFCTEDNGMNKACREFLKLCKAELQVREDLGVLENRRKFGNVAI